MRSLDATPDARNFAVPVQSISAGQPAKCFDLRQRKYKLPICFVDGVIAQLVERLNGIQEVRSSSLLGSTISNMVQKRLTCYEWRSWFQPINQRKSKEAIPTFIFIAPNFI